MSQPDDIDPQHLLIFNQQMLAQTVALITAHRETDSPPYAQPVGAHLRHVIEHYEALLHPATAGVVDYDQRPRDRALEHDPGVAQHRVQTLQRRVSLLQGTPLDAPLKVHGLCGLTGEFRYTTASTLCRELVFVASHAIHHFALLQAHCKQHGINVGAEFGRAPSTVANSRATRHATEDTACRTTLLAA
jgi:hypothetical protein